MSKRDITTKLAATEASLKRWQTRLKRAAKMVHDLDRRRRRYQLMLLSEGQPVVATVKKQIETDHLSEAQFKDFVSRGQTAQAAVDALTVPAFLDRADPLIAEKMTAARKTAEAEARKAMPLSGRDAMKAVKRKK